jgi:hypothetical protein
MADVLEHGSVPLQRPGFALGTGIHVEKSLSPLSDLPGTWVGRGFNQIWRPFDGAEAGAPSQDCSLALNVTSENLTFTTIGTVPNRGLTEPDISLTGVRYLQQINDVNFPPPQGGNALHLEPGFWLDIPATPDTANNPTVVRLSTIPHGNSILLEGGLNQGEVASSDGPPTIAPISITPFAIGNEASKVAFPESNLAQATQFRNPLPPEIAQHQEIVDDPTVVLRNANQALVNEGFGIQSTTKLHVVSTEQNGGALSIPFLNQNALVGEVDATFWVEQVFKGGTLAFLQLQYAQRVLLNFKGLSWPHVTVATLTLSH